MHLASVAETKVWKRIQEIAHNFSAPLGLAPNPDTQFEILREECRRTFGRENPVLSVDEQHWKSTPMGIFLDRHKTEIKEWLHDNLDHVSIRSSSSSGLSIPGRSPE